LLGFASDRKASDPLLNFCYGFEIALERAVVYICY
jgi:hypothetical protein